MSVHDGCDEGVVVGGEGCEDEEDGGAGCVPGLLAFAGVDVGGAAHQADCAHYTQN